MERKVIWTITARVKFEAVMAYLREKWSDKTANDFAQKVEEKLDQLAKFPESGTKSKKVEGVRKAVVNKQNSIFYRFTDKLLIVLTFFDNRQNPDNSKY